MKRAIYSLAATLLLSIVMLSVPAQAANLFGVDCNQHRNSEAAVCTGNDGSNPVAGTGGVLLGIAYIISYIAGAAAIIILIISGINYVTSSGDPAKVKSARDTATGALIGIVVIVLARAMIAFVLNTLNP
jgi:hypothetical protein